MRIGLVSDIHGNAAGLAAAIEAMGRIDELWCAGDIVSQSWFCNDTVALLRAHEARCVLGNHDLMLLSAQGAAARRAPHVDPELVDYLAGLPHSVETVADGRRVLMTHATPLPPHEEYVWPHSAELQRLGTVEADVLILGHTHQAMAVQVGPVLVVNPGSTGQPVAHPDGPRLSCATLDTATGEFRVQSLPAVR